LRRRIDGQDSQRSLAKSRQPSDLGGDARGLNLKAQRRNQEPSGFGISGFAEAGVLPVEIAISDFPKNQEPLIYGDTWHEILGSRDSTFGIFQCKGIATFEIAITRFPIEWREEATWQGEIARAYRSSGFRDSWC
jgi:hypothetical protein